MNIIEQAEARQKAAWAVVDAAQTVALNAKGTSPRHTRARSGGCRDDCIPCGLAALDRALDDLRNVGGRDERMTEGSE